MNTKRPYRSGDLDPDRPPLDPDSAATLEACASAFEGFTVKDSLGCAVAMDSFLLDEARRGFPTVVLRVSVNELSRIAEAIEQERA